MSGLWKRSITLVHERMFVASRVLCRSHLAAASRSSGMATASRPVLRGVIFDMDGTLTKPNLDFTEMYRRVRAPLNLSYARDPAG